MHSFVNHYLFVVSILHCQPSPNQKEELKVDIGVSLVMKLKDQRFKLNI